MHPSVAATGHGVPMGGPRLQAGLGELARRFDELAVPPHGRYVNAPVFSDEKGVLAVPPPVSDPAMKVGAVVAMAAIAGAAFLFVTGKGRRA
jgi:hypothetical protein